MGSHSAERPMEEPWLPLPAQTYYETLHSPDSKLPDGWLKAEEPADLSNLINIEYDQQDLERLARRAADAAMDEVQAAYRSPFIVNAALAAARLALGIKELPPLEAKND
ncbi:hypothetical protein H7097_04045 [Aeromicrobium sp.]|nr:hypothetical protein [Candidatus Saccharibacteria bacterium]